MPAATLEVTFSPASKIVVRRWISGSYVGVFVFLGCRRTRSTAWRDPLLL